MTAQAETVHRVTRRAALAGGASAAALIGLGGPTARQAFAQKTAFNPYAAAVNTGPSSATVPALGATPSAAGTPYIIPTAPGWSATSLMTTGNDIGGYRMSGIPDGLGAFDNGDRTITILMNHELAAGRGPIRGHGGKGAFVSRWILDKDTLAVTSGRDFVTTPSKLFLRSGEGFKAAEASEGKRLDISRLCSADLPPVAALFNKASGKGYNGRIFLNGEEAGANNANRAFAWVIEEDAAYELGAFAFGTPGDATNPPPSWENLVANGATGDTTLVMAMSDGGSNQVYCYIGSKQAAGNPAEKAGLTNGRLYALRIGDVSREDRNSNIGLTKSLAGKGPGKPVSFVEPNKGTSFLRPEDGAWDLRNPNVFYFVTTDRNNLAADGTVRDDKMDVNQIGRSRLWAVTFDDVTRIAPGALPSARIEMLLDGTEGGDMFDNIAVDQNGIVYLCEDPGNSRHNGKIWAYDTATGSFATIMKFDPAKFGDIVDKAYTPPVAPFVDDKETSGIIDVTDLVRDAAWYRAGSTVLLVAVQAHFAYDTSDKIGAELAEGGQLLLLVKAA